MDAEALVVTVFYLLLSFQEQTCSYTGIKCSCITMKLSWRFLSRQVRFLSSPTGCLYIQRSHSNTVISNEHTGHNFLSDLQRARHLGRCFKGKCYLMFSLVLSCTQLVSYTETSNLGTSSLQRNSSIWIKRNWMYRMKNTEEIKHGAKLVVVGSKDDFSHSGQNYFINLFVVTNIIYTMSSLITYLFNL